MIRGVIVGIDQYLDPQISSLQYACADAKAVYELIQQSVASDDLSVELLMNEDATKKSLLKSIGEQLPRVSSKDDIVILFFSGHGSPETSSNIDKVSRYLITYDTEYDDIYATAIDMERDLPRWFERLQCKLIILLLDTCFSGRAGGRTFEGPALRLIRSEWRGPIRLKELELGEGRIMLAACDDDEVAREESALEHGIFTYYLLESLKRPSATEKTISIHNLYEQVANSVIAHTHGRQTPVIVGRSANARLPRLAQTD